MAAGPSLRADGRVWQAERWQAVARVALAEPLEGRGQAEMHEQWLEW